MPDPNPNPNPDPNSNPNPNPAPWHAGIEAETLGFWQNKGLAVDDPKALAASLTKSYRELERHMGVPPDQLIKLPKAGAPAEEWKAVWNRLGAPNEAKEYDFNGVKFNGQDLDPGFADSMRSALAQAFVPKDRATGIVQSVVKYLEDAEKAETAVTTSKVAEEKANLQKNWGTNFDYNHLKAIEGARRLGITPEAVKALEGQVGYAATMEAFRKIGAGTTEDMFVDSVRGTAGNPVTREGAIARKAELEKNAVWVKRYLSGDADAGREMNALIQQIDGVA
jgi:hypothetical protein